MLRAIILTLALLMAAGPLDAQVAVHGDRMNLPKGCGSCHRGHGFPNTAMLPERKTTFCFTCHGPAEKIEKARRKGLLGSGAKGIDLQREFEKPYRHPIEKDSIAGRRRSLPETDAAMPRQVGCGDCHNQHFVSGENKLARVGGLGKGRRKTREAEFEYEVCFKCHSISANLPVNQKNKAEQFDPANPSFHPVMAQGKSRNVPSLLPPWSEESLVKCTDCHNSDDRRSAQGPHGSVYPHILARHYAVMDGAESPFQYALCYDCHRRDSILGDQSFPYHRAHIVARGISCSGCHNAHGSVQNRHLLDFDNVSIRPSQSGRLEYINLGSRAGQCFLECHGKEHNPATYPAGLATPARARTPSGFR